MPSRPRPAAAKHAASAAEPAQDLRHRILDAAERLLDTEGVAALSMREVARRSGVTHQAPYHHFADREAILAELVVRGFNELTARLAMANDQIPVAGRLEAGIACGLAYIGFAIDHPGLFRVMFRPELCDLSRFPGAQQSGEAAYAQLERLVAEVHGAEAVASFAMVYWSQVHGLACLIIDGPFGLQLAGADERHAFARSALEPFARQMLASGGPG
jgi:AcrR family transcriptional regulator